MSLARVVWCFVPLALSFCLVIFLEDKINRWFAPFTQASPVTSASPDAAASPGPGGKKRPKSNKDHFKVLLDPGHGGRGEHKGTTTGDDWDPALDEFLTGYLNGGSRVVNKITYTEHEFVLALAKRIKMWLDRTTDDRRWPEFEALIRRYQDMQKMPVKRVWIDCSMTRENSYLDHPDAANPNVDKYFRLFDGPDIVPYTAGAPLYPGRLSKINAAAADLMLGLHVNDSFVGSLRGSTALFVPPYQVYDQFRQAVLNQKPWDEVHNSPYFTCWSFSKPPGYHRQELADDVARYFFDGAGNKLSRQKTGRADRIQWRYRTDPPVERHDLAGKFDGPFWERERSIYEGYRRNGGVEEIGGDNLFSGQELVRFMRYALWKDFLKKPGPLPFPAQPVKAGRTSVDPDLPPPGQTAASVVPGDPASAAPLNTAYGLPFAPEAYLGLHKPPLCSDWLISEYTNSVAAYLEVAYLSNPADLWLLDNKLDVIAEGIAVGVYSLMTGLKVKDLPGLPSPRGAPVDWDRYYDTPWGRSWFEMARPDGAR